jgi:hypothetical protein
MKIVPNLLVQISISVISLRVLHRNKTNDSRTVNIGAYANVIQCIKHYDVAEKAVVVHLISGDVTYSHLY